MTETELLAAMVEAFLRPLIEDYPDIAFKASLTEDGKGLLEARMWSGKALRTCSLACESIELRIIVRELCELEEPDAMSALKLILKKGRFNG